MLRLALVAFAAFAFVAPARAEVPESLREQVLRGDDRAALAALRSLDLTPERRYLRARLLERLGEQAAAVEDYAGDLPELVRDSASKRRAHLLAVLGRCAEALPLLSERGRQPRADRAECLARTARSEEEKQAARAAIRRTLAARRTDTYELRELLAQITPDEAGAIRREAMLQHPTHHSVDLSAIEWTAEERLRLGETLLAARHPERALPLMRGTPPDN